MPKLTIAGTEISVSAELVARQADRMFKLGGEERRRLYAEKARKRLEAAPQRRRGDAAIVIAAGG